MLRQLRERHELLWALTIKELKVQYKRATLGILWTVPTALRPDAGADDHLRAGPPDSCPALSPPTPGRPSPLDILPPRPGGPRRASVTAPGRAKWMGGP